MASSVGKGRGKRLTDSERADSGGFRDKRQRGGFSKNVPFEDELFHWICSVRARQVPLLVSQVQQKAKLLSSRHKMNEDFKASNGWYYRFCNRYGLTPAALHTGASSEPQNATGELKRDRTEATHEWTILKDQIKQYGPEFVYTVTEARLFYQMLPKVIGVTEHSSGNTTGMIADAAADAVERNGAIQTPGKIARVLVLLCVNATGTHKIPLLVVGKEKVPACLAALHPQLLRDDMSSIYSGVGVGASYYSQREERLSFLETPDDEKYRLIQPWAAIPPSLVQNGWVKSNLGNNSVLSAPIVTTTQQSDDAVVMELCSMIRKLHLANDMNKVAKELRLWLHVDDDSSEQMQQELLYDIQQLLQDEEQQQESGKKIIAQVSEQQQIPFQLQQQQNATAAFLDTALSASFDPNQDGSHLQGPMKH
eukprot:jgi/Phyca11/21102/fgenesh1_pg.PHYCAscaffold_82_\